MNHTPDLSMLTDDQLCDMLTRLAVTLHHPSMNEVDRPLVDAVYQQARCELANRRP